MAIARARPRLFLYCDSYGSWNLPSLPVALLNPLPPSLVLPVCSRVASQPPARSLFALSPPLLQFRVKKSRCCPPMPSTPSSYRVRHETW